MPNVNVICYNTIDQAIKLLRQYDASDAKYLDEEEPIDFLEKLYTILYEKLFDDKKIIEERIYLLSKYLEQNQA